MRFLLLSLVFLVIGCTTTPSEVIQRPTVNTPTPTPFQTDWRESRQLARLAIPLTKSPTPTQIPTSAPTATPEPTATATPQPIAVHTPSPEFLAVLALTAEEISPKSTPVPPTLTPTVTPLPTPVPTPFPVTNGTDSIPLIEKAFQFVEGRVDKDGLPLRSKDYYNIELGIRDYYARDFELRCLTEQGTILLFDKALDRDYPGYKFLYSQSKAERHENRTFGGLGSEVKTRRGDWSLRYVDWWIEHKATLT